MRNDWALFVHLNEGDPLVFPTEPLTFGIISQIASLIRHSNQILRPPTAALRLAFNRFTNLATTFLFPHHHFRGGSPIPVIQHQSLAALCCHALSTFSINHIFGRVDDHDTQSLPFLSLAAAVMLPLNHWRTPNMLPARGQEAGAELLESLERIPCDRGCTRTHSVPDLRWVTHTVEPKTGIEFPASLSTIIAKENQSNLSSEVLVGTGSRIMTIIKIKSLKVYAFGFYVHPSTLCQKLGSKYASVPVPELKDRNEFYEDLLREDISMSVRLVVNCNGMKINTVRDAFEKSLRARLVKTYPETDFECIAAFGSYFTKDIPLPVGTIINFRKTADGQLITEIGGNQIGAVRSRELCRAFFDMYLGEGPVSAHTKEEIGRNVASIIRRC